MVRVVNTLDSWVTKKDLSRDFRENENIIGFHEDLQLETESISKPQPASKMPLYTKTRNHFALMHALLVLIIEPVHVSPTKSETLLAN
jgi:hypothetical protein